MNLVLTHIWLMGVNCDGFWASCGHMLHLPYVYMVLKENISRVHGLVILM